MKLIDEKLHKNKAAENEKSNLCPLLWLPVKHRKVTQGNGLNDIIAKPPYYLKKDLGKCS